MSEILVQAVGKNVAEDKDVAPGVEKVASVAEKD